MARAYTDPILFGAAYYDEYIPRDLDRIDTDMEMMTRAGINVIRIGESTHSHANPSPGISTGRTSTARSTRRPTPEST